VFFITDCHQKPTFSYEIVGDRLHLIAEPGAGLVSATSKLQWDIDGDGTPDADPKTGQVYSSADLFVLLGDTRTSVTLFIADPVTRKTVKVTRVIRVPEPAAPATEEK